MRFRFPSLRFIAPVAMLLATLPLAAVAQDDAPSLGDLARSLRKNKSEQQPQQQPDPASDKVIDNDNMTQVMDDARDARPVKQDKTVFSIDPSGNTVKVSSPDVTCSLSFNARASSLLIKPILIEDLPLTELLKLDGPGSIQDESLQLEVFNGTDWDIREITIGLTLERKPGENAELAARARVIPAAEGLAPITVERRSDVTLLYHLKAESKPFSTTAFHENIGITPGADEDWRWSIVEAKGIRPSHAQSDADSLQEPMFASPSLLMPDSSGPQLPPISPVIPDKPAPDKPSLEKPPSASPTPLR
ncbi:MAG TPA: hypothetical protein VKH18_18145 [Terriglobales bacterium]|nr:hypothetical protein [Terriglobales bacterium]